MARTESKGVSWRRESAQQTGLWEGGEATLSFLYGMFDYGQRGKHAALIVTMKDQDGEDHEEPYGVGRKRWKISSDGTRLIPAEGQTGLPASCDAMVYMLGPLQEKLEEAGLLDTMPGGDDDDITVFDGIVAVMKRVPVEKRNFREDRNQQRRRGGSDGDEQKDSDLPKTKLVVDSIVSVPWEQGGKGKKAAGKAAGGKGKKAAADDDEEEPTPPSKGSSAGSRGAKRATAADDDSGSDDLDEMAEQALIELLEDESPRKLEDLEDAALALLKGNPDRKAIAAKVADADFLDSVAAVEVDERKGTVALAKRRR